jgi:hypothetical protein
MEDDVDTSPGGEYYTSPNSPASSSRNWQEDLEGGEHPLWASTQTLSYYVVLTRTVLIAHQLVQTHGVMLRTLAILQLFSNYKR